MERDKIVKKRLSELKKALGNDGINDNALWTKIEKIYGNSFAFFVDISYVENMGGEGLSDKLYDFSFELARECSKAKNNVYISKMKEFKETIGNKPFSEEDLCENVNTVFGDYFESIWDVNDAYEYEIELPDDLKEWFDELLNRCHEEDKKHFENDFRRFRKNVEESESHSKSELLNIIDITFAKDIENIDDIEKTIRTYDCIDNELVEWFHDLCLKCKVDEFKKEIDEIVASNDTMWYDKCYFNEADEYEDDEDYDGDEDYEEDEDYEKDDDGEESTSKKKYPGFLVIHCDSKEKADNINIELKKIFDEIDGRIDKLIEEETERVDTDCVWKNHFSLLDMITIDNMIHIYYSLDAFAEVFYGSGEIIQVYMDLGRDIKGTIDNLFSRKEYQDVKYEGFVNVRYRDNYTNDCVIYGITNMH